jgi:cyclin-dependent kinase 9
MNPKDREKFLEELEFPFCDEVNKYEKMAKIGQGTFGEVFKARHKKNKKIVALKKVLMENEKEGVSYVLVRNILKYIILTSFLFDSVPYHCLERDSDSPTAET